MSLNIANNLKRLRKERKFTQEDLARFIGVSFQVISKWECGDSYPDITMLPVLAKFYNTTLDELVGAENETSGTDEKIFQTTIEELGLSVRAYNCLRRAGIATVRDLVGKPEEEMKNIRSLGKREFDGIAWKLGTLGLSFRQERSVV